MGAGVTQLPVALRRKPERSPPGAVFLNGTPSDRTAELGRGVLRLQIRPRSRIQQAGISTQSCAVR